MNSKYVIYYGIGCILIVIAIIVSMLVIKKWEGENSEKEKTKEEIEDIKKYELENKVPKDIRVKITKTGEIVTMDIDDYLKGVVPSEMPPSYDIEALRAQAVVARTYTFEKMKSGSHKEYDICDNYACCQAYYNKEKILEIWITRGFDKALRDSYLAKVEEAVNSTNNVVITYKGEYIKAYFHANSGGITEDSSEIWGKQNIPYLIPVESLGEEEHEYYKTEVKFTEAELEQKLNESTDIKCNVDLNDESNIKILSYTKSGRVATIQVGNNIYEGTDIRTKLGLKSTNFTVETVDNNIVFNVKGYGHGLGMSQTGSNYYAKNGWTYDQIIKHYYNGVDITRAKE